ncbi:DUF302 domain-containing protein [Flammeovirga aprica]|uniref:DUF302 domain-containing protein n=1 Tax=Flammeovirga aprica JL-4 TaxID=694437 RepID=A0A7X9RVK5_9BACT|nr:DUF302 domain-containing protein [Flammeovirga aprica]NME69515.1 DUF302 domain-containing protein [Flammeovirga aprica JL-4]
MNNLIFTALLFFLISCSGNTITDYTALTVRNKVDAEVDHLKNAISPFQKITQIDHSRLAKDEGVYTPPAVVTIFSDKKVNAELLKKDQLIGVDLPFKILLYSEPDTQNVTLAYTSAEFIQRRHSLTGQDVKQFRNEISQVINKFPKAIYAQNYDRKVEDEYGLIIQQSTKPFQKTINDLKVAILSQDDTQMFADIDFQKESKEVGVDIPPTYLILFGGPAPGGKAMKNTPRLGLDAFCQKLLVFEKENGDVFIAYNDIEAFSDLYYETKTFPQMIINYRLGNTLGGAVE